MDEQQTAAIHPLRDAGIMSNVFAFLPGNWLYLGAVCSEWKAVYAGMPDRQVRSIPLYGNNKTVACGTKATLFSAVIASPATALLASSCGLAISTNDKLQLIAGLHADIETLSFLRELGMPLSETVNAAALSGRLSILQQLLSEQQCPRPTNLSHFAARRGSINMLDWLRTQAWWSFGFYTCAGAASGGHLAVLQRLRREGCDWDQITIAYAAASGGSIEVMEWLRQQGIEIDVNVMGAAACAGQIAMCEYLHITGCAWNANTCSRAAESGQLDALHWLREHGCPWSVHDVCIYTARTGHTHIFDYVIEQGEVLDAQLLTEALNCAGAFSRLQLAKWLRQHGAQWPAVLQRREQSGMVLPWSAKSIAWARAEGCTSPTTP
jgi:hypothetical protein